MPTSAHLGHPGFIYSFSGSCRFLSNFYTNLHSYIEWQGLDFESVEHAYQASKCANRDHARWFSVGYCRKCHHHSEDHRLSNCSMTFDSETGLPLMWFNNGRSKFEKVTAGDAKRMGRHVKLIAGWDEAKLSVMLELLRIKFQIPEMRAMMMTTGDAELIEGNTWNDRYWGVCAGTGENHLGKLLMQVRAELRT